MTDDIEQRIRARAFQLWNEEGQPDGKEQEHWERARAEIEGQSGTESQTGDDTRNNLTPPVNNLTPPVPSMGP